MEILNSGSFIPLDNREKIEQLIFTAQTLASEVSRSEGFQSSGQTNQQIGLELWKGAGYMTRSHEEVTIRNLFLSKFLERLREIERETPQQPSRTIGPAKPLVEDASALDSAMPPATQTELETESTVEARDEFLGVVDSEEQVEERSSYANECIPECEEEIASMLTASGANPVVKSTSNPPVEQKPIAGGQEKIIDSKNDDYGAIPIDTVVEVENAITPSIENSDASVAADLLFTEQAVKSVVLSEKEPYNFDSCTVTAVIQLLPERDGLRDCVVSVRSHDFAPQIIFTNLRGESGELDLSAPISTALQQYRNALPILAAEKMKKEQVPTKKRTTKASSKSTNNAAEKADTNSDASPSASPIPQEQAQDQQILFAS
ncbi:MAG: hypothetical protein ACKVQW_12245 [Pyrinomonadaceae bacterium]